MIGRDSMFLATDDVAYLPVPGAAVPKLAGGVAIIEPFRVAC
jgi:hypothetical protein